MFRRDRWCFQYAFSNAQWRRLPTFRLGASGTHSQRSVEQIVVFAVPKEILNADFGALERAQIPHFADCSRSDVAGLDDLHQLVLVVEAVWRTVIISQCGFFRGLCTGTGPN